MRVSTSMETGRGWRVSRLSEVAGDVSFKFLPYHRVRLQEEGWYDHNGMVETLHSFEVQRWG